jgi:transcriptional regulator with XRE-family HTH domain
MLIHTDEALLKLIGNRIRELRKERKLSLRDVAFKIGMEPSNLSVIENGKSNPQILTCARIAYDRVSNCSNKTISQGICLEE